MKILDKYLLKKYFITFFFTIILLIPIAVAIDVSEKTDKFLRHENLSIYEIIKDYYVNFVIFYTNMFMPLALFIAVILFTSKIASNTEIIAINSGGISFSRIVKIYIFGALIVFLISFYTNHFIVPSANKKFEAFQEKYLRHTKQTKHSVNNVNLQLNENGDYIYIKAFNFKSNSGTYFSYEHFDGLKLKYKITGRRISYNKKDGIFTLKDYKKRHLLKENDIIEKGKTLDTIFNFKPSDLIYIDYLAKEMNSTKLYQHIKKSEKRGVKNLNTYKVELYKRSSIPVSSFILTIIAFSLAQKKKRGGAGINLALGIALMFVYVFFMKIAEVLGASATSNPLFMVWLPNIIFGILAIYLYFNAKK
ncbi:MAG: LptF/LptG family permease [Flavobacteriaceae bacterium]|nr:LptF/LptG family permease [Flavobacteriaceae bacterium]